MQLKIRTLIINIIDCSLNKTLKKNKQKQSGILIKYQNRVLQMLTPDENKDTYLQYFHVAIICLTSGLSWRWTNISLRSIRQRMQVKTLISKRTFTPPLFKILAIFLTKRTFVVLDQFVFIFFGIHPVHTRADEIRCYTTFRAGSVSTIQSYIILLKCSLTQIKCYTWKSQGAQNIRLVINDANIVVDNFHKMSKIQITTFSQKFTCSLCNDPISEF